MSARRSAIGKAVVAIVVVAMALVAAVGISLLLAQVTSRTSTVTSLNGIELHVSINANTFAAGQSLNIAVAFFNNLTETNSIPTDDNWTIQGFPIAMWPACYVTAPLQFVVLSGNYSIDALRTMAANSTVGGGPFILCMEDCTVEHVIFQANSDLVNITGTGIFGPGPNGTGTNNPLGSYILTSNFTINGYWDYPLTSSDLQTFMTVGLTTDHPFVPGVYTLAVADEWGQVVILHFTVN